MVDEVEGLPEVKKNSCDSCPVSISGFNPWVSHTCESFGSTWARDSAELPWVDLFKYSWFNKAIYYDFLS